MAGLKKGAFTQRKSLFQRNPTEAWRNVWVVIRKDRGLDKINRYVNYFLGAFLPQMLYSTAK